MTNGWFIAGLAALALVSGIAAGLALAHLEWLLADRSRRRRARARGGVVGEPILGEGRKT